MISLRTARNWSGLLLLGCLATFRAEADGAHPCELLTESLVREHFVLVADVEIAQDDSSSSRFPNCGYRWRIMSQEAEDAAKAANQAKMMENIKAGRSPNEGINHYLGTHAQVRLTLAAFDSPEKAQSGLESAKSFMIGRDEQRGREPTPWESVEGVGSKAYYHGTQLSFTWGSVLIHLDVSPQERAVALAQDIME